MKTNDNFYSPEELRMLDLIEYHKKHHLAQVEEGTDDDETFHKLHLLEESRKLVEECAQQRYEREQKEIKDKQQDLEERSMDECPDCEKELPATIIGEEISPDNGFLYDILVCSVCKAEYYGSMPNNHDDRVKYFENMRDFLLKPQENGVTMAEMIFGKEEAAKAVGQMDEYKNSHTEVLKSEVAAEESRKKLEGAFANMYKMLLAGKLGLYNLNTPDMLS